MKSRSKIAMMLSVLFGGYVNAQSDSLYYFSKKVHSSFEETTEKTKSLLKEQGFGIITEIDMHDKLAEKIENLNMLPYKILGACNPGFAYKTLQLEENIGLFLPCKVLIKKLDDHTTEVVMVNPSVLMSMLGNEELVSIADEVTERFRKALEGL